MRTVDTVEENPSELNFQSPHVTCLFTKEKLVTFWIIDKKKTTSEFSHPVARTP